MESIFNMRIWRCIKIKHILYFLLLIILLCVGFAIADYWLKTPTYFKYQPNIWDKLYDFFDKWASAGAPAMTLLAVIVALGIGLASIVQTRNIQIDESKRRMSSEMLDWAIGIIKCESEQPVPILPVIELQSVEAEQAKTTVQHINAVTYANSARRYQLLDARSQYMKVIAKTLDKKFGTEY